MPTVKQLKDWLETYDEDEVIAYAIWEIDDVAWIAEKNGIEIDKDTAKRVIEKVHHRQDANIGINWEIIECYL